MSACIRPTCLDFYSDCSLKQKSAGRNIAPNYPYSQPNSLLLFLKIVFLSGEAANANFIVLLGINCIWGEHANHYTANAVHSGIREKKKLLKSDFDI